MHSNVYKQCPGQETGTKRERNKGNTRKWKINSRRTKEMALCMLTLVQDCPWPHTQ